MKEWHAIQNLPVPNHERVLGIGGVIVSLYVRSYDIIACGLVPLLTTKQKWINTIQRLADGMVSFEPSPAG